jgi:2-haloacid dehalogenase
MTCWIKHVLGYVFSALMLRSTVAAHPGDLQASKRIGFKTAFVSRPLENGPDGPADTVSASSVDVTASDFFDLAAKLGG